MVKIVMNPLMQTNVNELKYRTISRKCGYDRQLVSKQLYLIFLFDRILFGI